MCFLYQRATILVARKDFETTNLMSYLPDVIALEALLLLDLISKKIPSISCQFHFFQENGNLKAEHFMSAL